MPNDPNATTIREKDERMQIERLADTMQRFVKRWEPYEPREKDEFERDLYYLIHLTYREAQAPLTKQLTDYMMRSPMIGLALKP